MGKLSFLCFIMNEVMKSETKLHYQFVGVTGLSISSYSSKPN